MPPFAIQLLGPGHLAALGLIFLLPLALAIFARRTGSAPLQHGIACTLAALLVAEKLVVLHLAHRHGTLGLQTALPMHLCDWASIATILALIGRWPLAYELAYFWGLAGTVQAVLTPDLEGDLPELSAVLFFISHGGVIASVLYLTFGLGMRARRRAVVRTLLWTNGYVLAACAVNALTGANYGYLCAKPGQPSLLDHLGPWPFYILSLEALACVFFLALYAPFYIADRRKEG